MKTKILKLLKEADTYLSGQELCEQFGVSRTAVWKAIRQLEEEGFVIEAVRNKGYKLSESPDVMSRSELMSCIRGKWAGSRVEYYEEVDSTNTRAKRLAEEGACHGTLVVAEQQNQGRGRRGRAWTSPTGTGIWMSLILRPEIAPDSASMLTLVAALAVVRAIEETTGIHTQIKWPNDIVAEGKKLCGILTEMSAEPGSVHYVVAGIGINANIPSFPEELADKATSLYLIQGRPVQRSLLTAAVLHAFELYYDSFLRDGNLSSLVEEYHQKLVNMGGEVRVLDPRSEYTGICKGINSQGELLVERSDHSVSSVVSGEVSVRGVYGYV